MGNQEAPSHYLREAYIVFYKWLWSAICWLTMKGNQRRSQKNLNAICCISAHVELSWFFLEYANTIEKNLAFTNRTLIRNVSNPENERIRAISVMNDGLLVVAFNRHLRILRNDSTDLVFNLPSSPLFEGKFLRGWQLRLGTVLVISS